MKARPLQVILVLVSLGLPACSGSWTHVRTPVPVRACVITGGPWTAPSAPFGVGGHISETMEAVNAIWNPADIAFIFLPEAKVIDDPQPPGMLLDVPPYVAKGMPGDVRMDDTRGFGSDEAQAAVEKCNDAWSPGVPASDQPGFTVVFVRELIWTDGGPTDHGGYSADLSTVYSAKKMDLCVPPYRVSQTDVAGRWTIIETFDRNYSGPAPNLMTIVAHELGHDLLLRHGDGLDNDQNGAWDEYCDAAEANGGMSLMDTHPGMSTVLTPLQQELGKASAVVVRTANP